MTLFEKLSEDLKQAMKSGDKRRVETIRLLRSQLKDAQIARMRPLTPEEELEVLNSAAKRRRESIEAYAKAGRNDLVADETAELDVIAAYLPQALSREEIIALIETAIQETGARDLKDLGKVMGKIMPQAKGRADGKLLQQLVRERLS
ncbi:MAG: GatB/YqeY domain-containing protein [candidate division KSB1 bacterium]|nr:GatB/YqeY domain-containing protein [candidate division KSB1 bacterium]MDZ7275692.1 GatB/YqeY domain-containing protein [candidate division KSB1 bacterium]MDZ7284617.1 GatB/YqeY domain-containing protein [candidate division KSB1 bacterium]MDZ7297964.1 GatB/YqeY domain-containing protein [candidate division KSB1 bacterium]MDZ7305868.1 GatB/YqeY domain-containing protein [candidate division KSB1 bacterium]